MKSHLAKCEICDFNFEYISMPTYMRVMHDNDKLREHEKKTYIWDSSVCYCTAYLLVKISENMYLCMLKILCPPLISKFPTKSKMS